MNCTLLMHSNHNSVYVPCCTVLVTAITITGSNIDNNGKTMLEQ